MLNDDTDGAYETLAAILQLQVGKEGYRELLRRVQLHVQAEIARLTRTGRFWCAQPLDEGVRP